MKLVHSDARPVGGWRPDEALLGIWDRLAAGAGRPEWPVSLALVADDEMADLNRRYRGVEGPTDVLSFSYLEEAEAGREELPAGENGARTGLRRGDDSAPGEPVGEIVVAPRFVVDRCRSNGWPVRDEFALLIVHGLLHLLGWDHADPREAARMRGIEARWLAREAVEHPLKGKEA